MKSVTHGVRWSSLHRLDYRDPVNHTVLGMMHNWIEGILQHHARIKWGIGDAVKAPKDRDQDHGQTSTSRITSAAEFNIDIDIDMLNEELADFISNFGFRQYSVP
jgi:hypothetical protein